MVDPFGDIYLDGEHLGRDRDVSRETPLGRHALRIEREGFVPVETTLDLKAGDGPKVLRYRLKPKPALLKVAASTPRAVLSLDGRLIGPVGPGGREVPIPFPRNPSGGYLLESTQVLRLEAEGYRPYERRIRFLPGRVETVRVDLEPLPVEREAP
ncbi:MAG: PEGA domain-containing protein [Deltaproteobacteria bacterium]|nr:MAG: PEGA domain-containing protein [Deltaproteobacteria bacterium]